MQQEFWQDFKIFVLTVLVLIFIVVPIVGFLFQRDVQKGNLKLGELIKNLFREMV